MTNKFMLRCAVVALILLGQVTLKENVALAETADDPPKTNQGRTIPSSFVNNKSDKSDLLTLNFLRDTGLSLQQIKQQAINIYLEVTREDVQPEDKFALTYPKSISDKGLFKSSCYLAPRIEWLYFYVGTMEPIIHLFTNDVDNTKSGVAKTLVPKVAKASMSPLWQEWAAGIKSLNGHLTAIYKLADEDTSNNVDIARHAVSMYRIATNLEKTREKGVTIMRKTELKGEQSEPVDIQ